MATFQIKRGTSGNASSVTPASGEPIYLTDTKTLRIGDGSTAGGANVQVASANVVTDAAQPNITSVGTLTGLTVNGTVTANVLTSPTGVDLRIEDAGNIVLQANTTNTGQGIFVNNTIGISSDAVGNAIVGIGAGPQRVAASGSTGGAGLVVIRSGLNTDADSNTKPTVAIFDHTDNGYVDPGSPTLVSDKERAGATVLLSMFNGNINTTTAATNYVLADWALGRIAWFANSGQQNGSGYAHPASITVKAEKDWNNNSNISAGMYFQYTPTNGGRGTPRTFLRARELETTLSGGDKIMLKPIVNYGDTGLRRALNSVQDQIWAQAGYYNGGGTATTEGSGSLLQVRDTRTDGAVALGINRTVGTSQASYELLLDAGTANLALRDVTNNSVIAKFNNTNGVILDKITPGSSGNITLNKTIIEDSFGGFGIPQLTVQSPSGFGQRGELNIKRGDHADPFRLVADTRGDISPNYAHLYIAEGSNNIMEFSGTHGARVNDNNLSMLRSGSGDVKFTMERSAGTAQSFTWNVRNGENKLTLIDDTNSVEVAEFANSSINLYGTTYVTSDLIVDGGSRVNGDYMRIEYPSTGDVRLGIKRTGGTVADYDWLLRSGEDRITLFDRTNTTDIFSANIGGGQFNVPMTVQSNNPTLTLTSPGTAPAGLVIKKGASQDSGNIPVPSEFSFVANEVTNQGANSYAKLQLAQRDPSGGGTFVEFAEFSLVNGSKYLNSYLTIDETTAVKDTRFIIKRTGGTPQGYQLNIKQGETQLTLVDETANVDIAEFANGSVKINGTLLGQRVDTATVSKGGTYTPAATISNYIELEITNTGSGTEILINVTNLTVSGQGGMYAFLVYNNSGSAQDIKLQNNGVTGANSIKNLANGDREMITVYCVGNYASAEAMTAIG